MTSRAHTAATAALLPVALASVLAACGSASGPGGGSTPVGTAPGATTQGVPPSDQPTTGTADTPELVEMQPVSVGDVMLRTRMGVGFAQWPDDPAIRRAPGLVVEYTVHNAGGEDVIAHDRVPAGLGSATLPEDLDPEHAWVHMQDGVVRVTKQGFGTSPSVNYIAAPVTGARVVPAGGTLEGRAAVPVPLQADVPDQNFTAPRDPVDAKATTWQFCLQVGQGGAGATPHAADPELLVVPVQAPTAEALVCTQPIALVLP